MEKQLYKGSFNYSGDINILYVWAVDEIDAFKLFLRRMGRKYQRNYLSLYSYFYGKDRYHIIKVPKEEIKKDMW